MERNREKGGIPFRLPRIPNVKKFLKTNEIRYERRDFPQALFLLILFKFTQFLKGINF
jgi:hypothetical protein